MNTDLTLFKIVAAVAVVGAFALLVVGAYDLATGVVSSMHAMAGAY